MIEFEINGVQYRADKLDAKRQFHLSRKLAPVVPKLVPMFAKLAALAKAADGAAMTDTIMGDLSGFADAAAPFMDALAQMREDDADYVLNCCLSVVKMNQGGMWTPMARDGVLMFSDLDLSQLLPLVVRVIRDNLGNFIRGLLASPAAQQATQGTAQ